MAKKKGKSKNKEQKDVKTVGFGLLIASAFILLSFVIIKDKNLLGPIGEIIARVLYLIIGKAAYILPFITAFLAVNILKQSDKYSNTKALLGFTILILSASVLTGLVFNKPPNNTFVLEEVKAFYSSKELADWWKEMPEKLRIMNRHKFFTAGYAGEHTARFLTSWFNIIGAYIITVLAMLLSLILLGKEKLLFMAWKYFSGFIVKLVKGVFTAVKVTGEATAGFIKRFRKYMEENKEKKPAKKKEPKPEKKKPEKEKISVEDLKKANQDTVPEEKKIRKERQKKEKLNVITAQDKPKKPAAVQSIIKGDYKLPPSSLLSSVDVKGGAVDYTHDAERLKKTLNDFGIEGEVVNVVDGPVISRFEVELATGVKVSRVENLATDIALAMKVEQVRVAPIPGQSLLGIEVPKQNKKMIFLKDVIEDDAFQNSNSLLSLAIGRDIGGRPVVANLPDMPHLLIAGATGSGKSVCINTVIMSILYKATPDEVKLLLVDPKRVELTHYRDLAHLLAPVITDPKHAAFVLKKLIAEMDYRYEILAGEGAQNINIYNSMVEEFNSQLGDDKEANPEDFKKSLPYIVLIIDELADLMLLAKGSVEDSLRRLAQLARAVGIHLVLATQRPSVDVITGVIKANFPSRIAFQVMSQVDSRTILDTKGADSLLGKGDMLYAPSDLNKPIRGQAAYVSGEDVSKVVHFIKKQRKPEISEEFKIPQDKEIDLDAIARGDDGDNSLIEKAVQIARERGEISTSYLQRKLGVGYSKAARLIDDMEEKGYVTPPDGNKPRKYIGE